MAAHGSREKAEAGMALIEAFLKENNIPYARMERPLKISIESMPGIKGEAGMAHIVWNGTRCAYQCIGRAFVRRPDLSSAVFCDTTEDVIAQLEAFLGAARFTADEAKAGIFELAGYLSDINEPYTLKRFWGGDYQLCHGEIGDTDYASIRWKSETEDGRGRFECAGDLFRHASLYAPNMSQIKLAFGRILEG